MKKKLSRSANRIISISCLAIFFISLVCLGTFTYRIYASYRENERLKQEYQNLLQEIARLEEYDFKVDDDGYYNVYSNGEEMVVYGNGETVIITIK